MIEWYPQRSTRRLLGTDRAQIATQRVAAGLELARGGLEGNLHFNVPESIVDDLSARRATYRGRPNSCVTGRHFAWRHLFLKSIYTKT